jgi:hypothetical protein
VKVGLWLRSSIELSASKFRKEFAIMISQSYRIRRSAVACVIFSVFFLVGSLAAWGQTATNIQVSNTVQQPSVHRLGINLGDQGYWDSGQMLKNLVFQNPGFEGLKYRSILHCAVVSANTCTDDNQYSSQPTGYWTKGTYLILSGKAAGTSGVIASSTQNPSTCSGCGQIIAFDKSVNMAVGDYVALTNWGRGLVG